MGDSFDGDFKKFFKNAQELSSKVESDFERCVRIATGEMIQTAKEKTPPLPGQQRGRNTVTGALADHWGSRFEKANGDNYNVYLFNNMQYASYVNDGHRMVKHFVPWLYIDSNGVIARHIPITGEQLFGLVVGTSNIATSTLTNWTFDSWHIKSGERKNGGKQDVFGNHADTSKVFSKTADKLFHQGMEGKACHL